MRYGYFDNEHREYVIDRVDVPVSWTNYIGLKDMYGVFNHTAGGYLLYKSPEYHRITRFRPNGVPWIRTPATTGQRSLWAPFRILYLEFSSVWTWTTRTS